MELNEWSGEGLNDLVLLSRALGIKVVSGYPPNNLLGSKFLVKQLLVLWPLCLGLQARLFRQFIDTNLYVCMYSNYLVSQDSKCLDEMWQLASFFGVMQQPDWQCTSISAYGRYNTLLTKNLQQKFACSTALITVCNFDSKCFCFPGWIYLP
jgi:hypothetical protein